MTAPIPFPAGIARDMAKVRLLAADLQRLITDLDHQVTITPTAYARIGNLADDAWNKGHDLQAALNQIGLTAADRMCAEQDRSYSVDNARQLVAALSNLTDGGAA
jgi:hypothetical protein